MVDASAPPPRPVVICGPSGVGALIITQLFASFSDRGLSSSVWPIPSTNNRVLIHLFRYTGKGTLIELLQNHFPASKFGFCVSHTTRQPRDGEVDGVHYHFSSVDTMKTEIEQGKFVEYAQVHGNYYGTR